MLLGLSVENTFVSSGSSNTSGLYKVNNMAKITLREQRIIG